jgi:hypothetical protein
LKNNKYCLSIFTVKTPEMKLKTISTHVGLLDNFESTINKFTERFVQQNFKLMGVIAFISESDFRDEWERIKQNPDIPWPLKNNTLLCLRNDIEEKVLFCEDGFRLRTYANALRQDV